MPASDPQISVLVSSYQRPDNLRRVLHSLAVQQGVRGQFEVIVTDDGSTDETPDIVSAAARIVPYRLRFTTHPHDGFQLARCRNEGAATADAPYFLFLDGDCIVPPDHIRQHLRRRRPGVAMAGFCYWFDRATTERITAEAIDSSDYLRWVEPRGLRDVRCFDWKARFYELIRHPTKPKLYGGNAGVWRKDYERINGYDERFVGWGCEDDDFRLRLRRSGVKVRSIVRWTRTYHLWHPPSPSTPQRWWEGANVSYYHRPIRFRRCRQGLKKLSPEQLVFRVVGRPACPEKASPLLTRLPARETRGDSPDYEILFAPGEGQFTGQADCNVLVVLDDSKTVEKLAHRADVVVANKPYESRRASWRFSLADFERVLRDVA